MATPEVAHDSVDHSARTRRRCRSAVHVVERTQAGEELVWGDVRVFEAGQRLVLGFAIGADRKPAPIEKSSEVELRFERAHRDGTRMILAELRRGIRVLGVANAMR